MIPFTMVIGIVILITVSNEKGKRRQGSTVGISAN